MLYRFPLFIILIILFLTLQLMKLANDNQFVDNFILPFKVKDQIQASILNAIILYLLPVFTSLAILLLLFWHSKRHPLHCQNSKLRNSISKSLLFSTMLQSWMWFICLYGYQLRGLSLLKDFLLSRRAVISTVYMPFVDIGYYAFGIMGVLYLIEFPFLLWCINTKVMAVDRRGMQRRQCILNMPKSVGCAGMVLFLQVASWYSIYYLIGLLVYPLFVIVVVAIFLLTFIFLTASTALLFLPCLTRCRRCPQQSAPIVFLLLMALICTGCIFFLAHASESKLDTSYNTSQIVSGIFASGILTLSVYTIKSMLTHDMLIYDSQVGTDEPDEQQMLLSAEVHP